MRTPAHLTQSHNASLAFGFALLVVFGMVAASCSGPGTTSDPGPETPRQAYRIQVYMTSDQAEAERVAEQVRAWWRQLPADERPASLIDSGVDPKVVWQQPYYRIRVGRFTDRSGAEPALRVLRNQFRDAFIVPVPATPVTSR